MLRLAANLLASAAFVGFGLIALGAFFIFKGPLRF